MTYDAWNRLAKVQRAYPDSDADGNCEVGSEVAIIAYDGLGRRISKAVIVPRYTSDQKDG